MGKPKYRKPAIQEVIFEAKFDYDNFDVALPGQFFEKVKDEFPEKKNLRVINIEVNSNNKIKHELLKETQVPRFQAWKRDQTAVLQIGPGMVTANEFNHTSWEDFIPIISKALTAYIDCAEPTLVTRVGVRYINNFFLAEENANINDYFDFGVYLPPEFVNLNGFDLKFLNKIKSKFSEREFNVNTTFATKQLASAEKSGRLLLDIDCSYFQTCKPDSKEIINLCKEAHEIISNLFENFLKDKARHLMEVEY